MSQMMVTVTIYFIHPSRNIVVFSWVSSGLKLWCMYGCLYICTLGTFYQLVVELIFRFCCI